MKLPTIRSERFIISVKVAGNLHKIFQIVFFTGKNSGNTYSMVTFPYFSKSKGLLSRVTFPANQKTADSISLIPEGKVTSHLAKYTHPLDGNSHFSGDGKIYTKIRNQSKRLDSSIGHFFTIQVQGVEEFKLREDKKNLTQSKTDIDFDFIDEIPEAIKFVAYWVKATDLKGNINSSQPKKPIFVFREKDGTLSDAGFVLSPPEDSKLKDFSLLLTCRKIPILNPNNLATFSFIGGFDEKQQLAEDLHFLTCTYPAEEYEELEKQIGSIDFNPLNPLINPIS